MKQTGAFSLSAPNIWNSLPYGIRSSNSINKFRIALKTHYFRLAFKDSDEIYNDIEYVI